MSAGDVLLKPEECVSLLEAARAVVVANGGGYGMGLAYAREMIHPG